MSFEIIGSSDSIAVDARVVAATNRNLMEEVSRGRFREDLYWRLNVVPVVLPPLRARVEDIPLLLNFYVDKLNGLYDRCVYLDETAMLRLCAYQWPGNVRELSNMVERLVIMAEKNTITGEDLPFNVSCVGGNQLPEMDSGCCNQDNLGSEVERLERRSILQALKETNGIQQKASKLLGITPRQLGYRIKKYGIDLRNL